MSSGPNSSAGQEAAGNEAEGRDKSLARGRTSGAASGTWGSFRLLELVGRGSFGEVYRAWDPHLERDVGLKILLPRSEGDEAQFKALLREARALAAVRHPNIVPVHGIDEHDGLVGFWTDFVHGKTLASLVREQGPFGYREAALAGIDVCKALSAVHRAGLLHRDIKAENVMREEGGRILLMDFGLSTLPHLQKDFAGTPVYMAPELFAGAPASVESDIYAVGALLFFLVTGRHPSGLQATASGMPQTAGSDELTSDMAVVSKASARALTSRSVLDHRPDLPEAFVRAIDAAIHPEPAKRFASAGAMLSALSEVLVETGKEAPSQPTPPRPARWRRYAALALALALIARVGGWAYLRYGGRTGAGQASANGAAPSADLNEKYLQAMNLLRRADRQKNVSDAAGILKAVLARDPQFALAQSGLGTAYFIQYRDSSTPGLLDQARAACNRAIAIDPNLAPPYVTLARIEAMAGNNALATQDVERALELDPHSADAYGAQSEVYSAEGREADAIAAVVRAMDLAPDNWRWPVVLGAYYFNAGQLKEASEQFAKATQITPDNAIALRDLGLASLELGRFDAARANLEKAAGLEPNYPAFSALGTLLELEGKYAESVTMYQKALALSPNDYTAWGNLASGYLWSPGGHDQAIKAYRKAIDLAEVRRKETPEDPLLLAGLGGYYAAVADRDHSLPLLRQAVALAPDNPDVLFLSGEGYEILHQRNPAIRLISESIALGYHEIELQRSPELAALRADPGFQQALRAARAKHSADKQSLDKAKQNS
jgi:serine/threonine protein kinase/Tfp pilus assembly protein PilF